MSRWRQGIKMLAFLCENRVDIAPGLCIIIASAGASAPDKKGNNAAVERSQDRNLPDAPGRQISGLTTQPDEPVAVGRTNHNSRWAARRKILQ
ncbi:MAG TPA: hypothetical protein PL033_15440 [Candidatus Brocadiia bacterium]|nr:hypothetical protein [Candidatus Brocadiia bacterium]